MCGAAKFIVLSVIALAMMMTGCGDRKSGSSGNVVIETDLGTIKFELLDNEAPKTAENFRLLAERGYYNGTIFHRVIAGFMIRAAIRTATEAAENPRQARRCQMRSTEIHLFTRAAISAGLWRWRTREDPRPAGASFLSCISAIRCPRTTPSLAG